MDLTLRQLEQFLAVAQEEHVGRAAARLHISQPPLTQAVHRMERILGVTLLEPAGRGVRLTAAGRTLAADASAILAASEAAVDRVRRVAGGLLGTVRVGCVASLALDFLPQVLRAAATELPDVRLDLVQQASSSLLAALDRGELDVAVVRAASLPVGADVAAHPVREERLRLAVPADHTLASRRRVRLAEVAGESFAGFGVRGDAGAGGDRGEDGDALHAACAEAGFAPRVVAEAGDLSGLLAWVLAGRAVAVVPAGAAALGAPGVRLVDVVGPGSELLRIRFAATTRPGPDAAVARVVDIMTRAGSSARRRP